MRNYSKLEGKWKFGHKSALFYINWHEMEHTCMDGDNLVCIEKAKIMLSYSIKKNLNRVLLCLDKIGVKWGICG